MKVQKKMMDITLIAMVALSVAACSTNGQPPASEMTRQAVDISTPEQTSYASQYQTSVFLGDSITEGLSYHDVLKDKNVLAGAGKTAEFALQDIDELVKRKPQHIFIQLGSDDILWPTDNPKEYSLSYYGQLIDRIKVRLPETSITILSVTPVTAEAEKAEPRYRNIGDYNEGLKELSSKVQVGFIDVSSIVSAHPDMYDADGIHFQAEFYPILLDYVKNELGRQKSAK
ncbi:GDSL-type esterase/lipase family protein [Brevibacillus porteri]|uniref:Lysophospholipase n=1 Tax=Brevibacillus porteri TaxID=2126350 RepID=A0ABX5FJX4_9BACL|nr:GDSL-type esterase/lipase family protein [Brevibacillus porteri]MED1801166.1 GDSL-type esterase/lipase family protein [Brevibacillus porteri]MED2134634.1 GDSL-type esterase/lipase family protein [Brevibacillus porteri]MED2745866.1 GDSL-type esterase/lipase family protein [Brevibacillus porteri]MED2813045.1 GDSL-type esterase/lipase family protein [Brevibacillus porteri]MED2897967.1 GDSL-type esterase/lipase family protein [Brevibacillus porteri]